MNLKTIIMEIRYRLTRRDDMTIGELVRLRRKLGLSVSQKVDQPQRASSGYAGFSQETVDPKNDPPAIIYVTQREEESEGGKGGVSGDESKEVHD